MKGKVAIVGTGQGAVTFALEWLRKKVVSPEDLVLYEPPVRHRTKRFDALAGADHWTHRISDPTDPSKVASTHGTDSGLPASHLLWEHRALYVTWRFGEEVLSLQHLCLHDAHQHLMAPCTSF